MSHKYADKTDKKTKVLVTAGPTIEYIDPVRFITNKSSGKQGYELAKCLSRRGFETTLIFDLRIRDIIFFAYALSIECIEVK